MEELGLSDIYENVSSTVLGHTKRKIKGVRNVNVIAFQLAETYPGCSQRHLANVIAKSFVSLIHFFVAIIFNVLSVSNCVGCFRTLKSPMMKKKLAVTLPDHGSKD